MLGSLLRYSLDRSPGTLVSLSEEWELTQAYLRLEEKRLGNRLQVGYELGPEAARWRVPPFIIQPLVENAVLHGISPLPEGGTIQVSAEISDGELVVKVRDDGRGIVESDHPSSGGHGHCLLVERLRTLYGERASACFGPAPEGGFEAVVRLPPSSGDGGGT